MYRLEINNSGAWKILGEFQMSDAKPVMDSAELLARGLAASSGKEPFKMRITEGPTVISHWFWSAKRWVRYDQANRGAAA